MDDLISRQSVKEWLGRWEGYLDTDMIARMQLKVDDILTHPTPSNTLGALDCVERQAAIDTSLEFFVEFLGGAFHENAQKELITRFQRLTSAQPRTGKWIDGMCSECEESTQGFLTNFCPNCGADMRGEQNGLEL